MSKMPPSYTSTTNACKLCKPLGASLAFRGIEGAVPFLHGSQGCATYMRRYIISHFNEPIDIASSSLGEKHAVYGGSANLKLGLNNVTKKYNPQLIGVATTCLTETIGDDVKRIISEYKAEFYNGEKPCKGEKSFELGKSFKLEKSEIDKVSKRDPYIISVSTPSYSGTHIEGFHAAIKAVVEQLTEPAGLINEIHASPDDIHTLEDTFPVTALTRESVNFMPGFVSAADLRYLKEVLTDFGISFTLFPDYSESLDGEALNDYPLIPSGGTPIENIKKMGWAKITIECGSTLPKESAGTALAQMYGTPLYRTSLPIGIRETDKLMDKLEEISKREIPARYRSARGRLVDAMVDGHKYLSGKRAIVYGEEDLVVGLTSFLAEIGIKPIICASGGKSGQLNQAIANVVEGLAPLPQVYEDVDFYDIEERAESLDIDILVGHSKGYAFSRKKGVPLIRVGFPIHDRIGGQRILHLGYHGAQMLFDAITNTIIAKKQDDSPIGYSYM
ncbi:MAG: nitrogenase [Desulfamplus sp.]|nr:nitrogenase [Desulfamplus sp.]